MQFITDLSQRYRENTQQMPPLRDAAPEWDNQVSAFDQFDSVEETPQKQVPEVRVHKPSLAGGFAVQ